MISESCSRFGDSLNLFRYLILVLGCFSSVGLPVEVFTGGGWSQGKLNDEGENALFERGLGGLINGGLG